MVFWAKYDQITWGKGFLGSVAHITKAIL